MRITLTPEQLQQLLAKQELELVIPLLIKVTAFRTRRRNRLWVPVQITVRIGLGEDGWNPWFELLPEEG